MAAVLEGPAPLGPLAGPAAEFQVARVGRFHRPLGELAAVLVDGDGRVAPLVQIDAKDDHDQRLLRLVRDNRGPLGGHT